VRWKSWHNDVCWYLHQTFCTVHSR